MDSKWKLYVVKSEQAWKMPRLCLHYMVIPVVLNVSMLMYGQDEVLFYSAFQSFYLVIFAPANNQNNTLTDAKFLGRM